MQSLGSVERASSSAVESTVEPDPNVDSQITLMDKFALLSFDLHVLIPPGVITDFVCGNPLLQDSSTCLLCLLKVLTSGMFF